MGRSALLKRLKENNAAGACPGRARRCVGANNSEMIHLELASVAIKVSGLTAVDDGSGAVITYAELLATVDRIATCVSRCQHMVCVDVYSNFAFHQPSRPIFAGTQYVSAALRIGRSL